MNKKKHYICVTPFFPSPGNWRGAYVLDQVKAIQKNSNYEVVVFMAGKGDDYQIDGIPVHLYRTCELPSNILNGFFNGYNATSFVKRVLELGIDPHEVAIVHCHVSMRAACGLALKKLNPNIKVLLQHHDLDPFNLRSGVIARNNSINIRYRARKAIELYNQVDLHICISEAARDCLLQFPKPRKVDVYADYIRALNLCKGLPSTKTKDTFVLYNGVDTGIFNANGNGNLNENKIFRIGCIANFQDLKDHITLIKAVENLLSKGYSNIRLSLLGTGETRQICYRYIEEHGMSDYLEWPKEVTHEKLPNYYRSLDLFVLPSFFEGFGCVFTEAAACGVPFMGCKNQGYSEYIPDEDAHHWLIEPKDYKTLANLIESQMNNPQQQRYSHPYDIDILIRDFLDYIQAL